MGKRTLQTLSGKSDPQAMETDGNANQYFYAGKIIQYSSMKNNHWKERLNIVYSTNPDFQYETENREDEPDTLPKEKQRLRVCLDKRNRGGKQVTLISGFAGKEEDLQTLAKFLKTKCGVGGSAKDNEIIIQGDFREKIKEILIAAGYLKTIRN
jgi:translation initiation factor 1